MGGGHVGGSLRPPPSEKNGYELIYEYFNIFFFFFSPFVVHKKTAVGLFRLFPSPPPSLDTRTSEISRMDIYAIILPRDDIALETTLDGVRTHTPALPHKP